MILTSPMIGARLKAARQKARIPQRLAQAVIGNITRPTFIAMEQGRREASPAEIVALCRLYGCAVSDIMGGTAARLAKSEPLGMLADVIEWVRRLDQAKVSEGQLMRFLNLDRIATRMLVQSLRSMATVIAAQVGPMDLTEITK